MFFGFFELILALNRLFSDIAVKLTSKHISYVKTREVENLVLDNFLHQNRFEALVDRDRLGFGKRKANVVKKTVIKDQRERISRVVLRFVGSLLHIQHLVDDFWLFLAD